MHGVSVVIFVPSYLGLQQFTWPPSLARRLLHQHADCVPGPLDDQSRGTLHADSSAIVSLYHAHMSTWDAPNVNDPCGGVT